MDEGIRWWSVPERGGGEMARHGDDVPSITNAPSPLSLDISGRTRRYLISMGARTACFIGAILTTGPLRYTLLVGAVLLPYIAVVVANAGREPTRGAGPSFLPTGPAALPPGGVTGISPTGSSVEPPDGSAGRAA